MIIGSALAAFCVLTLSGCSQRSSKEVVIYCSEDQVYSEPILREFERRTGIRVYAVYDSEAVKSVGLMSRIRAEARQPQADVFWNNEIARTCQLWKEGIVEQPLAFAARVRVIVYHMQLVKPEDAPRSIFDLADPKWRGKVAMSNPLAGSTQSQAAALFAALGPESAQAYYRALRLNDAQIYEGNSVACEQIGHGRCLVGITDTDDYWERKSQGMPIAMVYPDQDPSQSPLYRDRAGPLGCYAYPNSVALVTHCSHPANGRQLIGYLHSREVEQKLAFGPARQIPILGPDVPVPDGVRRLSELKVMVVPDEQVANAMPAANAFLEKLFIR